MGSALKKRLKDRPTTEDITRATEELMTDGHRGTAVLSCALLDDLIKFGILCNMVTLTPTEHDELFVGYKPLASFSAKIQLAYAIGLIGKKVRHDLNSIREIRNAIAHTALQIDFSSPEIKSLCHGFHCKPLIDKREQKNTKTLFVCATRIMMIHLISKWSPDKSFIPKEIMELS
jgi:hypothetical protein